MLNLEILQSAPESSLEISVKNASPEGMFLEFGVAKGESIRKIAEHTTNIVYGFDWFQGLPEDWFAEYNKGYFACDIPINLPDNINLIIGLFEDTLPEFVKTTQNNVSFLHIDCDLYSSTKTIFTHLTPKIQSGTIIVFDELYGYPGFEQHEYKVFSEFLENTKYEIECIGKWSAHQAVFKIL